MSMHRVFIPTVVATEMLELPDSLEIRGAQVQNGELILIVSSEEELGGIEVNALYGNIEEDEETVHFGMFETRAS